MYKCGQLAVNSVSSSKLGECAKQSELSALKSMHALSALVHYSCLQLKWMLTSEKYNDHNAI